MTPTAATKITAKRLIKAGTTNVDVWYNHSLGLTVKYALEVYGAASRHPLILKQVLRPTTKIPSVAINLSPDPMEEQTSISPSTRTY